MILSKEINLPKIPEELLSESSLESYVTNIVTDIGYGIAHTKNGKKLNPCKYSSGIIRDPALFDWLKNQIKHIEPWSVLIQIQEHPTGGTHIVHSDIKRKYALNYMIELGDSATTSWYKEHDKPLHRSKQFGTQQSDGGVVEYKNLETLKSAVFEKHKWYIIATDVLHDVDNVVGTRKSISIGVTSVEMFNFLIKL
jgi:hypothetical protein